MSITSKPSDRPYVVRPVVHAVADRGEIHDEIKHWALGVPFGRLGGAIDATVRRAAIEDGNAHAALMCGMAMVLHMEGDREVAHNLIHAAASLGDPEAMAAMAWIMVRDAVTTCNPDHIDESRLERIRAVGLWTSRALKGVEAASRRLRHAIGQAAGGGDADGGKPARRRPSFVDALLGKDAADTAKKRADAKEQEAEKVAPAGALPGDWAIDVHDDEDPFDLPVHATPKIPRLQVVRGEAPTSKEDSKESLSAYRQCMRAFDPQPLLGSGADPAVFKRDVLTRMPWMREAAEEIAMDIVAARELGRPSLTVRPLLLVGPPAAGKSFFCQLASQALGLPVRTLNLGGNHDGRILSGTSAGWANQSPSFPVRAVHETMCANPVVVLEEIDKAGRGHNGDPHAMLLAMLEAPGGVYYDDGLTREAVIGRVSWLMTANTTAGLPPALLSRLRVVRVGGPATRADFYGLLDSMVADLAREWGRQPWAMVTLTASERDGLWRAYRSGADVRAVRRVVERLAAHEAAEARTLPN